MTDYSDSGLNETELDKIVMKNEWFEKEISVLEVQSGEIKGNFLCLDECSAQVKQMTENTDKKLELLEKDVQQLKQVPAILEAMEASVDEVFKKVDSIQSSVFDQAYPRDFASQPAFSISVPLEEQLQLCQQEYDDLEKCLDQNKEDSDLIHFEREEIQNERDSVAKAIKKAEKEVSALKEELQQRKNALDTKKAVVSERNSKIAALQEELDKEEKKKQEAQQQLQNALNTHDAQVELRLQRQMSHEAKMRKLQELTELLENPLTPAILLQFQNSGLSEFDSLLSEISAFYSENPPLISSLADEFSEYAEMNEESIENLGSKLKKVKKDKKTTLRRVKEMRAAKEKYDVATETLKSKKEELEKVQNKIARHTLIIKEHEVLAISAHPVSLGKRISKTQEVLREPSFRVPDGQIIPRTPNETKGTTVPLTADFTESVAIENSEQYPGIRAIKPQDLIEPEGNVSGDVFNEDSTLTEETGTTQDDNIINDFFGELNNPALPEPVSVEFSMTQHFADFEKREKEAKLKKTVQESEGEEQDAEMNEDDLDIIFNETGRTDNNSLFSQNIISPPRRNNAAKKQISPIMSQRSTRNVAKINYNEDEDEEDDDMNDSLFVLKKGRKMGSLSSDDSGDEDEEHLDQSSWGSED